MNYTNTILCWGDSITEGMAMRDKSYPSRLQEMLRNEYTVLNGGDGGENTVTIVARQGALKLFTENDIVFEKGESEVVIGNQDNNGFVSKTGDKLKLTALLGNQLPVNDIEICGEKFTISLKDFSWSPITYTAVLKRNNSESFLKLPKNSQVTLNSTDLANKGGIDIYLIGANGGFDKSSEKLIEQFKLMIDYHGSDRYIIVAPFWTSDYDKALEEAFANHIVNYRENACKWGLEFEGLVPTEEDLERIELGRTPPSLCYKNKPDVHLNEYGYHFLAHLIFEKGKELKLF